MAITLRGTTVDGVQYTIPIPDTDYLLDSRDLGGTGFMYVWNVSGGNPFTVGTGYNFGSQAYIRNPIVYGDYAYVAEATGGACDLFIIDISNPLAPSLTKQYSVGDRPGINAYVTDGSYWVLSNTNSFSSGKVMFVHNVVDKENPYQEGYSGISTNYDTPTRVFYHPLDPDWVLTCKNDVGVVTDISTKATPTLTWTWDSTLFTKAGNYSWFETAQIGPSGYLFAGWNDYGNDPPGGIEIYDISNPNPSTWSVVGEIVDTDYGSGYYPFNVVGNYIYGVGRIISNYWITMIDISDLSNPTVVDNTVYPAVGTGQKYTWFMTTAAGDPIIAISEFGAKITTWDVDVEAYEFAGTLTDAATISIINPSNFSIIRQKSFPVGDYSFPSVTDTTPQHVLAERDTDGAMLIYSDVTPTLYSSN